MVTAAVLMIPLVHALVLRKAPLSSETGEFREQRVVFLLSRRIGRVIRTVPSDRPQNIRMFNNIVQFLMLSTPSENSPWALLESKGIVALMPDFHHAGTPGVQILLVSHRPPLDKVVSAVHHTILPAREIRSETH